MTTKFVEVKENRFWSLGNDIDSRYVPHEDVETERASLVIPADQIKGMTDLEIGKLVRNYLLEAHAFHIHCYAQHLLRYKTHYMLPMKLNRLHEILRTLVPYKEWSEAIQKAISLIRKTLEGQPVQNFNSTSEKNSSKSKPRYVYLITDGRFIKIGVSKDVETRLNLLQVGNPKELSIIADYEVEKPAKLEKIIHEHYRDKRTNSEWFKLTKHNIEVIKRYLNQQ